MDGSCNIAHVHRVVLLVATLWHHPLPTFSRLFDELAIERERAVTRFFPRTVDRYKTQCNKLDTIGFAIISADLFTTDLDGPVQIRRALGVILRHRLAGRRGIVAEDLTVDRFGAGKNNPFDLFSTRNLQNIRRPIDSYLDSKSWISLRRLRHQRRQV